MITRTQTMVKVVCWGIPYKPTALPPGSKLRKNTRMISAKPIVTMAR